MTGEPESRSRPTLGLGFSIAVSMVFLAIAAAKLWPGLSPNSLYLDDQWVAVALREAGLGRLLSLHLPMPVGFTLITDLLVRLVPSTPLAVQLLPVLAYLASIVLFPVLVHKLTGSPWASAFGVAVIASVPLTEAYAVRAKHYTLDELTTVVLLLGMTTLPKSPRARRFVYFAGLSLIGVMLSFASVFLSAAALLVAGLVSLRPNRPATEDERRRIVLTAAALILAEGAFYLLYLRPSARPIMQAFWSPYFLPLDGWSSASVFLRRRLSALFLGAMPANAPFLLAFAPLGLVWLWQTGRREYCATIGLFYGAIVFASALWVYPVGTGRTDVFSVPVTALLTCLGVFFAAGWIRSAGVRQLAYASMLLALLTIDLASPGAEYPQNEDGAAVAWVRERIGRSDGLVLSPYGALAYSYFGGGAVSLTPVDFYGHGFDAVPDRPLTFRSFLGRWDLTDAERVGAEVRRLGDFLDGAPRQVFYLETTPTPRSRALVLSAFAAHGYRLAEPRDFGGRAAAARFERVDPSA